MTFELDPADLEALSGWTSRENCFLCHSNGPFHRHHKRFRSHQGPDGAENLVLLCEVCHGAAHGLKVIKNGFSCALCPVLARGCYFGEALLGREIVTSPPWEIAQFDPIDR